MLILIGEAGVGKTALITVLAAEADRRGGLVVVGRSHESEKILPFGPWVDAFRTGQVTQDEQFVLSLNPVWRAELTRLLPEIGSPGLPMPSEDRRRLFDGVAHLLESLASTHPVTLILEDMHWADEMSVRLFSFVGRRLGASRMLVVASVREEELADAPALRGVLQEFQQESHVVQVPLAPLTREDTDTLVRSLVRKGTDEAGRIDEALTTATKAIDLCRARGERGREAYVLRLLGEIAAARKPVDVETGEDYYRQAIDVARQRGMRPLVAHCHLGLSKLYRRTGEREQAQEHLTTATTMYLEMGMTYWLEQAEPK